LRFLALSVTTSLKIPGAFLPPSVFTQTGPTAAVLVIQRDGCFTPESRPPCRAGDFRFGPQPDSCGAANLGHQRVWFPFNGPRGRLLDQREDRGCDGGSSSRGSERWRGRSWRGRGRGRASAYGGSGCDRIGLHAVRTLVFLGLHDISEDGLFPQRLAGFQAVQTVHEDKTIAVAPDQGFPVRSPACSGQFAGLFPA
jgi:hypothetical protein